MSDYQPISFRQLMALERINANTFRSTARAWPPGVPESMSVKAFGGHVYAQAAWSASQTVASDMIIHNVTGHFLLPGSTEIPFTYHVRLTRDGGVYCLRTVEVFQNSNVAADGRVPCFVATVSFKRKEREGRTVEYMHQNAPADHIAREYASVLADKKEEDHSLVPAADADWWQGESLREIEAHAQTFPGLDMRKVNMLAYNGKPDSVRVSKWRQLLFYRLLQDETPHDDERNLNLHACAHMYASDRNGLFIIVRALGQDRTRGQMGSLAHTVVFHGPSARINLLKSDGTPKWFVQESWTSNSGDNRICHNSRLWDHEAGVIIGTTLQDGMVRLLKDKSDSKI